MRLLWARAQYLARQRWFQRAVKVGFLLLSVAILGSVLFVYRATLLSVQWQIHPLPALVAIGLYYVDLFLVIRGWSRLIGRMGVSLPFREHARIYALTLVAGRIPGAPWHIAGRAATYAQHNVSKRLVGVASAVEMLLICVSGLLCGLFVAPVLPPSLRTPGWLLALLILAGIILLHPRIIGQLLRLVSRVDTDFSLAYRDSIIGVVQYGMAWLVGGALLFCIMQMLYPVPSTLLPSVIGIWSLSGGISIIVQFSPTGFGLRELTLSAMLALIVPPAIAVIVAIAMRVFLTSTELLAALVASRFPQLNYHNGSGLVDDTPA